jgi:hypothetical protein
VLAIFADHGLKGAAEIGRVEQPAQAPRLCVVAEAREEE